MNSCLKAINVQVQSWKKRDAERMRNKISTGLYSGLGGIAMALAASGNEDYIATTVEKP